MEKKNNFMPMMLYSIKEKKNWVLLSTVIIFVTTLLIPYILRANRPQNEVFIVVGIVELFILVFINCLLDNNFLHDESKLTYYRSKPVTLSRQILINIITNVIFAAYLILLIVLSVVFHSLDCEILESFKMLIPWLMAIILLASLSSVLSGNTLMAGAMTIFNFCLPWIIFLVTMFVFSILENLVIGFSADVLNDYFLNNVYRLDYLYFSVYMNKSIDLIYLILLSVVVIFISLLLNWNIKRRKNENTGFIVFDGFKYFVSVLACLIIPAFFSISMSRYTGFANRIFISLSLAVLSYYIIIAFIEKSFRISKLSIKVFVVSMVLFSTITGGTVLVANHYKDVVPNSEDVKIAYVGNQTWSVNALTRFLEDNQQNKTFEEWKREHGMITYEDLENIENITELHREILKDQTYSTEDYYGNNLVIAYWMKDGSTLIRHYKLEWEEQPTQAIEAKNAIANVILNSDEYRKQRYHYFYDEEYYGGRNLYGKLRKGYNYNEVYESVSLNDLRDAFLEDMKKTTAEDKSFAELTTGYYDKGAGDEYYYLEIYEKVSDAEENYLDEIVLRLDFTNTLEVFKK